MAANRACRQGPTRGDRRGTRWQGSKGDGRQVPTTKVFAIANQKGGVGKTTTTINLGAYLANAGRKTLVIDLDPQSNTTTGLGFDPHSGEKGLVVNELQVG